MKKPILTEKVSNLGDQGIYGFIVDKNANKIQIRKIIEKIYNVTIDKVCTMRYLGKTKVKYSKKKMLKGKTAAFKKAIVYLKPGEMLDLYNV